ncbi:MAG: hypothetical protein WCL04_05760 [Verrucomicrobiota bacterium]
MNTNPLLFDSGTGPTTANAYNQWLASNSGATGAKFNFYNVNDFALNGSHWQVDQELKPDWAAGNVTRPPTDELGPPYGYTGNGNAAPVENGFFKTRYHSDNPTGYGATVVGNVALHLGDSGGTANGNIADRYEIYAFADEPRSIALGAVPSVSGLSPQNLQSIWPADTLTNDPNKKYKDHPWHSAQFRFSNMDQANYWKTLLGQNGFNLK